MDPLIAGWCARHIGSPAVTTFFGVERLSAVHGVQLEDGREVVLKVRGAHPRHVASQLVHAANWAAGIPCPQPLAGPAPLVEAWHEVVPTSDGGMDLRGLAVSAETWEGVGVASVGPLGPDGYARILARMVAAAPALESLPSLDPPPPWLHWEHGAEDRVWPPPASHRWDPHRLDGEMDPMVHEVARRARARLSCPDVAALPRVAAHADFEAQNCRWVPDDGPTGRLVIHDWDSVAALPEAVLAGNSAFTYVSVEDCELTSMDQNDAFLAAYAEARGRRWSDLEWQVAHAAGAWVGAYNAAFEYLKGGPGPVARGLLEQAAWRLGRAAA